MTRRSVAAFAALAALAACSHSEPPAVAPTKCAPQKITVSILASTRANPTPTGEPRPVVVRLYQLKDDSRLFNASFEQMWHDDKTTLVDDIAKLDELTVYPASRTDVVFDRTDPVAHLAAVALFQEPKGHSWFSSFDLPPPPEPGKCDVQACRDDDEECAARAAGAAHYAFWIDGSTVDDGVERLDDFPQPGPMRKKP